MKSPNRFGGAALVASGILFTVLAFLDFRAGPPPSNGAGILLWRDAQALVLDFVSEVFFFATVLLVPGTMPWAIGLVLTLVCELSFAGWFVAVGSQLLRGRGNGA